MDVKELFLELVSYESTSVEDAPTCPSNPKELVLANRIAGIMKEMGIADAEVDKDGYVYGTVPATDPTLPTIGLISHMDTSPAESGRDVRVRETPPYDGKDVILNDTGAVLSPKEYPGLLRHTGKHLLVTDGRTLLGADDKAGVAEILACADRLLHTDKRHGAVRIAFTPDEEIGRGADRFDVEKFGAAFAYTVDGGTIGEIEYENFNAAAATVEIIGRNIHPGSARGKMKNAAIRAMEFNALLPCYEVPACTDGYEGFFHLCEMKGDENRAVLKYIIRDHDRVKFEARKKLMEDCVAFMNAKYGDGSATLSMKDSYYNMKEIIEGHMEIIRRAEEAMRRNGIEPVTLPIRGGTDGARLSFMGLPCPNLSTGGENFHSRFEYVPTEDLYAMVDVLEAILVP